MTILGCCLLLVLLPCFGCERPRPALPPLKKNLGPPLTVRITGHEFEWHIRYPGPDGRLDTPDDIETRRHLHVPADTRVTLALHSRDYVYSLFLPHADLLEVAVPDRRFTLQFETGEAGKFELLGSQMCGFAHPNLIGELVVHSQRDFDAWLREITPTRG